jgi:serine/threonine protein kinase
MNDKVYIIDFGTILKYKDKGDFLLTEKGSYFVGTMLYASINCHNYVTCSMRDDLESLGYCLLGLMCQNKGYWFEKILLDHKFFIKAKEDFIYAHYVDPRVIGIQLYLQQVKTLTFEQVPDYDSLKTLVGDFSYGMKAFQNKILEKYAQLILEEALSTASH